jgi:uncharacterized membrane protein
MVKLRKYFIAGIIVVIPVFLSLYVLVSIFGFLDNILGNFFSEYLKRTGGFYIPGLGLFIFALLILLIGWLATKFIGHKLFAKTEKWFSGLPLIKNTYPALKEVILFILAHKELGFKKVVLVEYPSRGIWSIGFLTNEQFEKINRVTAKEMLSVFIPNSPGILGGYVIFVPREEVKFLDLSVKEALNIIISGGVFKSEDNDKNHC